MSNYEDSKFNPGKVYLEGELESTWGRLEPLITPSQVKTRFLFGIPMVSYLPDPLTGKRQVVTDAVLEELILQAVAQIEMKTGAVIMPTQIRSRHPFDRALWEEYGFMTLPHRPAYSIDLFNIESTDGSLLMEVPLLWVETSYLQRGQLMVVPLSMITASTNGGQSSRATNGAAGALFLSILGSAWIPAFFTLKCSYGFPDGNIPIFINNLIGMQVAIMLLGMLAATYRTSSASLGIDGQSQSFSMNPNLYMARIQQLQDELDKGIRKAKALFGTKLLSNNV
jgi:hypothetical protein